MIIVHHSQKNSELASIGQVLSKSKGVLIGWEGKLKAGNTLQQKTTPSRKNDALVWHVTISGRILKLVVVRYYKHLYKNENEQIGSVPIGNGKRNMKQGQPDLI